MSTLAIASEPTASPVSRTSFREVWLVTIGHSLTHWYPATFYLLLPLIGHELGLNYVQIGSILTVQATAGALSNVPGGMLVEILLNNSLVVRLRQSLMKLTPARGAASLLPLRSGKWQALQIAW